MESITVHQRLRPVRYAFLIDAGDADAAIFAVSVNTAIWGGIYNPIVLATPEDTALGILKEFDPDFVVDLTKSGIPPTIASRFENRTLTRSDMIATDRHGRHTIGIGLSIKHVLAYLYKNEFRGTTNKSNAAIMRTVPDPWMPYASFVFGSYGLPGDLNDAYDHAFTKNVMASDAVLDPEQDQAYRDEFFPIFATAYGIRHNGGVSSLSNRIVCVGDHTIIGDLIEFWNIRATGRTAGFLPESNYERHSQMITDIIGGAPARDPSAILPRSDVVKMSGLTSTRFKEVGDWIRSLKDCPACFHETGPRYGLEIEFYVGDIHASSYRAAVGDESALFDDGNLTPIKLIANPFVESDSLHDGSTWCVELDIANPRDTSKYMFDLPPAPGLERLVHREFVGTNRGQVRIGRRGVALCVRAWEKHAHVVPIKTSDVFAEIIHKATGLEVRPSQPGRYADGIIHRMGNLGFDCRIFKIRGVREIIQKLSDGQSLDKAAMMQIVTDTTAGAHGQNWRDDLYKHLWIKGGRDTNFSTIFDVLLEKKVLRAGLTFTCGLCNKRTWYHVSEFGEEYVCRYCFERQRVRFGSVDTKDWRYKADGFFQLEDSAQGSVAVIVSLWRLAHVMNLRDGHFVTGIELARSSGGNAECELDYCWLDRTSMGPGYDLVFGEAKNFSDYGEEQLLRLEELAGKFNPPPFLAISTLKDQFSEDEKTLLQGLISRGCRVIPLTREELDPYDVFDRFENAPHPHTISLKELSVNAIHVNL